MNTSVLTRYRRFIIGGLLLGVLASTLAVYAEQVNQAATLVVAEETTTLIEESMITAAPEEVASTTIETISEIVASSTDSVIEAATTTEVTVPTTEGTITATTTVTEGTILASTTTINAEVNLTEEATTTSQTSIETTVMSPLEPDLAVTSDSTQIIIEPSPLTEELSEPILTPEECHTIFDQHGFRNPGECMRARGITNFQR